MSITRRRYTPDEDALILKTVKSAKEQGKSVDDELQDLSRRFGRDDIYSAGKRYYRYLKSRPASRELVASSNGETTKLVAPNITAKQPSKKVVSSDKPANISMNINATMERLPELLGKLKQAGIDVNLNVNIL